MVADGHPRNSATSLLESVSIAYLVLPAVLFVYAWLRPPIGLPLSLLILAGAGAAIRNAWKHPCRSHSYLGESLATRRGQIAHAGLLCAVTLFVICSPLSFSQAMRGGDYTKHIAFLADLSTGELPLFVPSWGYVVIYVGFYLPAAFVGRITGSWDATCFTLFFWTLLGAYILCLWLIQLTQRLSMAQGIVFFGFGGLDIAGYLFLKGAYPGPEKNLIVHWLIHTEHPETLKQNGVYWLYGGITDFLYYAPHHILPGLIILFLILYYSLQKKSSASLFFVYCVMPICSALLTIGLFPYVLFCLVKTRLRGIVTFRDLLVAPCVFLTLSLFILSNNADVPRGPLWEYQNLFVTLPLYLATMAFEFGVFIFLALRIKNSPLDQSTRWLIGIAVASILVLSFCRLGLYNDLTSKGSYPSQAVLLLCYFWIINSAEGAGEKRRARDLLLLMFIGCWAALHMFLAGADQVKLEMSHSRNVSIAGSNDPRRPHAGQLFSDGNAFFWRYMARRIDNREIDSD